MNAQKNFIAFNTIVRSEIVRFLRIWTQTFLPAVITTTLYYVIFGKFIGSQIAPIEGYSYMQFIVPGLVMMTVITSSFMNVVSSFFGSKFMHQLEELLVSPVSPLIIIAGYVTGGVVRGLLTGVLVLVVALFFTQLTVVHFGALIFFSLLTAIFFSLLGLITGIYAKNFDGVQIIPNFVLTPLTYLGGVFYSVQMLPQFWQYVSLGNPILYMVNGFRYGFLGLSDVPLFTSALLLIVMCLIAVGIILYLFKVGKGLRT